MPTPYQIPHTNGRYVTAPRSISRFARWFPALAFFARYLVIVIRASLVARRGHYDDQAWGASSLEVLHALEQVGVQFEITGMEHMEALEGPFIVAANHMSTLETMVLPAVVLAVSPCTFVVKKSLINYPLFGAVMRSRDPIAVSQTDPREDLKKVLREGVQRIEAGYSLVIFPEGSRTAKFDPARFNSLSVKLAARANVSVVPLALRTDAWAIGWPIPDIGRIDPSKPVKLAFGPPLAITGRGSQQQDELLRFIQSHLDSWGAPTVAANV
jgi:1-acyl-sn-glycerol-3-phosphate acyltransferase